MAKKKVEGQFNKGDKVEFSVGNGWVPAKVVELIPGKTGQRGKEHPTKVRMTTDSGAEVTRTVNSIRKAA